VQAATCHSRPAVAAPVPAARLPRDVRIAALQPGRQQHSVAANTQQQGQQQRQPGWPAGAAAALASAAVLLAPWTGAPPAALAVSGGGGSGNSLSFQDLSGQVGGVGVGGL
jgi:hypothetical protein